MWADRFVGLPFKRMGRGPAFFDCWGLSRHVFHCETGILLPSYDEDDPSGNSIASHAINHTSIPLAETKALDFAIILNEVRVGLKWKLAPIHIGIAVDAKNILHIEESVCSRVQPAADLRIHSIVRVTG